MKINISNYFAIAPVVVVRIISAFSSLILSYAALQILSSTDFGTFTFSISFVTFLSVFLRFGLDRYLLKIISNKQYFDHSRFVFFKILTTWFYLQLVLLPVSLLALYHLAFFDIVETYEVDLISMASCFSMVLVLADFFRAKISIALGLVVSGVILPAATLLYLLLVANPFLNDVFSFYIAVALFTVALCVAIVFFVTSGEGFGDVRVKVAWSELSNLLLHSVGAVGMIHLPILALGFLGAPEDVALFQKCFLLSMVIGAFTLVLTSVYEPKFARAVGGIGDADSKVLFESSLNLALIMVSVGAASAFFIFYNDIYIEFYPEDAWICFCLCLGHCINLLASRYQCYFMMTKNSVIRNVSVGALLVLILSILILFSGFGVLGVAIAYLVAVLFKLGAYSYTQRSLGW